MVVTNVLNIYVYIHIQIYRYVHTCISCMYVVTVQRNIYVHTSNICSVHMDTQFYDVDVIFFMSFILLGAVNV